MTDDTTAAAEEQLRHRVKNELRKRMRGLRKALPASACAARSARIAKALGDHEAVRCARSVALFWPIEERHEVDLRPLDSLLRSRGLRIAYPAIDAETGAMSFRFVGDAANMLEQGYGFREPSPKDRAALPGELDVIVVPALAIDPSGHRLGYGAGYYDRTLPSFEPHAITLGVAFDFQLLAEIPFTPGDVPVAWIVTDARILQAESGDLLTPQ